MPYAAGGGTDLITRALTDIVARDWKASVVIENRPGGGTTIASMVALGAPPDGYTLLLAGFSLTTLPAMAKTMPYDVNRDLTPIVQLVGVPNALVVRAESDIRSMKDLIAAARAALPHCAS